MNVTACAHTRPCWVVSATENYKVREGLGAAAASVVTRGRRYVTASLPLQKCEPLAQRAQTLIRGPMRNGGVVNDLTNEAGVTNASRKRSGSALNRAHSAQDRGSSRACAVAGWDDGAARRTSPGSSSAQILRPRARPVAAERSCACVTHPCTVLQHLDLLLLERQHLLQNGLAVVQRLVLLLQTNLVRFELFYLRVQHRHFVLWSARLVNNDSAAARERVTLPLLRFVATGYES